MADKKRAADNQVGSKCGHHRYPGGRGGRLPGRQQLRGMAREPHARPDRRDRDQRIAEHPLPRRRARRAARSAAPAEHARAAGVHGAARADPAAEGRRAIACARTCSITSRCPRCPNEKELWQRIDKELTDVDVLAGQIMRGDRGRPLRGRAAAAGGGAARRDRRRGRRDHGGHPAERGARGARWRT